MRILDSWRAFLTEYAMRDAEMRNTQDEVCLNFKKALQRLSESCNLKPNCKQILIPATTARCENTATPRTRSVPQRYLSLCSYLLKGVHTKKSSSRWCPIAKPGHQT